MGASDKRVEAGVSIICVLVTISIAIFTHYKDRQRGDELAQIRDELSEAVVQSSEHMSQVIRESIAKSETSAAFEVDNYGIVVSMNHNAKDWFDIQVGDSISRIIPPEYEEKHHQEFQESVDTNEQIVQRLTCEAVYKGGIRKPSTVDMWSIPGGFSAFVTPIEIEDE